MTLFEACNARASELVTPGFKGPKGQLVISIMAMATLYIHKFPFYSDNEYIKTNAKTFKEACFMEAQRTMDFALRKGS